MAALPPVRTDASKGYGMTNVVVLIGRLARPATSRQLPSGDSLVEYQLTVPRPNQRAESVPVVWEAPPASAAEYDTDAELVVVGRVRRRFFRTAARTESRTEVVAEAVVPLRQVKRVRAALSAARGRIEEAVR
jgi:single-strand DNA-binding protein